MSVRLTPFICVTSFQCLCSAASVNFVIKYIIMMMMMMMMTESENKLTLEHFSV